MSDEYEFEMPKGSFVPQPAIPKPMFEDVKLPPKPQKAERLSEDEIERITNNRNANLRKKRKVKKAPQRRVKAPVPEAPKNPNRPLEMKNRLHTVLGAVVQMSKQESVAFAGALSQMEDLSRSARRRVISALAQVYG